MAGLSALKPKANAPKYALSLSLSFSENLLPYMLNTRQHPLWYHSKKPVLGDTV